jgi:16S rRNA (uracil1498-N3)-methyltransferase
MPRRFFLPQPLNVSRVRLEGREAHHLTNVLRGQPGDEVILFDGAGLQARARILQIQPATQSGSNGTAELEILEAGPAASETCVPITLATAVPKGDRFEWLVEKATELGVSRLIPLVTERSIVNPGAGKLEKLRHAVVAASKQSGRSRLMEITDPVSWHDFLKREIPATQFCLADPSGETASTHTWSVDQPLILAIGPEGGLTDREVTAALNAGARTLRLGHQILRIETAAIALTAVLVATLEANSESAS